MGIKQVKDRIRDYLQTLIYCIRLSWEASGCYTVIRIVCEIIPPVLGIVNSFLVKYLLDLFAGELQFTAAYRVFILLAGCILAIKIFQNMSEKLQQYMQSVQNDILSEKLAMMLMQRAVSADLEYFDNTEYYDKLQAAARDQTSITQVLWDAMSFLGAFLSFSGVFAVLWMERPLYGILLLCAAIPYGVTSAKYTKSLYELSMEQINAERKKAYIQGISLDKRYAQDVRLFHIGDLLKQKYHCLWQEVYVKRKKIIRGKTATTVFFACLPELVCAGVGIDIGLHILKGNASVGDYSLYTGLMAQFLTAFFVMSFSFTNIYDNKLRIMNLKKVFEIKNRVIDDGTAELKSVDEIVFDHVSFSYPGTHRYTLEDVSFSLNKKEKIVFVGMNGSGKSTVIKLLLRMYEPDSGHVRINGRDIKEYSIQSLRKNFSVYFQEMGNYCMSLYENVTIGDAEREDEGAAVKALKQSCCDDILEKAGKGLNTSLTRVFDPNGIELSGGQFQKIALARTLYRRHTVLILDEPSSNLDPKAEHDIFEELKRTAEDKMTIFTSHRLSNVALADRIIVLEKGKVIEEGTQSELLKMNRRYAELFRYQSEKFRRQEA